MNYNRHYYLLIERAKNRNITGYYENHHIIPRCMNGSDNEDNLVKLTPEEHYLAHQLLVKMYPENRKLVRAAVMMIPKRPSNKMYGWLRRKFSQVQSEQQTGKYNSNYGLRWIHNKELQKSKKIKHDNPLPEGWIEGRIIKFDLLKYSCKVCSKSFDRKKMEIYCSDTCKRHDKSANNKIIDENLEEMITYYTKVKSINKTLKHFGVNGIRAGNNYLSKRLKERKINVLKRRNSKLPN